jgi:oxygen tolerance protein BatD
MRLQFLLMLAFAAPLLGSGIRVEPAEVRVGDAVEIFVTLEGTFAARTAIRLPYTTNLVVEQGPSVSSNFTWTNGASQRSRTFRYVARARRAGIATVGPIDLVDREGRKLRLDRVTIVVLPDAVHSNDPSIAIEQSRTIGGAFVTVQVDKTEPYLGEQVNLIWTLYSRDPLRGFRLTTVPVLEGFWTEEIPQTRQESEQVIVNGEILQKAVVRRIAVFPLKAGTETIAPMEVLAEILETDNFFGGWGFLERRVEDYRVRSSSVELRVKPVPAGVAAVGQFTLHCTAPNVPPQGPVTFDATVSGTGNLRAIDAPAFGGVVDAAVEVQPKTTTTSRDTQPIRMTRTWRYVMFPRTAGPLALPSLHFDYFDPASGSSGTLQCAEQHFTVTASNVVPSPSPGPRTVSVAQNPDLPAARNVTPIAAGVAALLVFATVYVRRARREANAPIVDVLWAHREDPAAMRRALFELVHNAGCRPAELFAEESNLGETFRALFSIIDLMEKEPWEAEESRPELRRRARDFERELQRRQRQPRAARSAIS